jgi:hypothetical protein
MVSVLMARLLLRLSRERSEPRQSPARLWLHGYGHGRCRAVTE